MVSQSGDEFGLAFVLKEAECCFQVLVSDSGESLILFSFEEVVLEEAGDSRGPFTLMGFVDGSV